MKRLLLSLLLCIQAALADDGNVRLEEVDKALIARMMPIAEKAFGKNAKTIPKVYFAPDYYVCVKTGRVPFPECNILGFYNNNYIVLNAHGVNIASPAGRSVLIHELVHHIQHENGQKYSAGQDCEDTENGAYDAQRLYLAAFGFKTDLGLGMPDRFTVKMRCMQ